MPGHSWAGRLLSSFAFLRCWRRAAAFIGAEWFLSATRLCICCFLVLLIVIVFFVLLLVAVFAAAFILVVFLLLQLALIVQLLVVLGPIAVLFVILWAFVNMGTFAVRTFLGKREENM